MNRRALLKLVNQKIPRHLGPVTEHVLDMLLERGFLDEPLQHDHVSKIVQFMGALEDIRPRQARPTLPPMVPEIDQVIEFAYTRDPAAAKAAVRSSAQWLPPGLLYINFTDQDYSVHSATARLEFFSEAGRVARIGGRLRPKESEMKRAATVSAMRLVHDAVNEAETESGPIVSGIKRLGIPEFPRNCLLGNWYILPNGKLVPDPYGGGLKVNYRYVHRVLAKIPDGEIKAIERLLGITFSGLTGDDARQHQAWIRQALERPQERFRGMAAGANYRIIVTTSPDAVALHSSAVGEEDHGFVVVRQFEGWLPYVYFSLLVDVAEILVGHSQIRHCENCGTLISRGHRDRRYCSKLENPECYRHRDTLRKRAKASTRK